MKLRKFLMVFAIIAVMSVIFAFSANAEIIQLDENFVESIEANETNARKSIVWNLIDGDIYSSGIYSDGNDWFGIAGDYVTITLKEETLLTKLVIYGTGNYSPYSVVCKNTAGETVASTTINPDGNTGSAVDATPYTIFDNESAPVAIKTITITRTAIKWEWNRGKCAKIAEVAMFTDHNHDYSKLDKTVTPPTCSLDGVGEYSCTCGGTELLPVPATGEHTEAEFIAFRNGFNETGYLVKGCPTCDTKDVPISEIGALFTPLGYSVSETGANGIQYGFAVNYENIALYTELAGYGLEFGIVAYSTNAFTGENALLTSPEGIISGDSTVICKNMTNSGYGFISYKIQGFADTAKDSEFVLAGYVFDGLYTYYLGDTSTLAPVAVSYNGVLNSVNN